MVVPLSVVILVGLFGIQRFGTGVVGRVLGPIMVVWFAVIATLGVVSVVKTPGVLQAVNPIHGVRYFIENGRRGFLSMGSLFLVVTGGEALCADMGALLLRDPSAIRSPFFSWRRTLFTCR